MLCSRSIPKSRGEKCNQVAVDSRECYIWGMLGGGILIRFVRSRNNGCQECDGLKKFNQSLNVVKQAWIRTKI